MPSSTENDPSQPPQHPVPTSSDSDISVVPPNNTTTSPPFDQPHAIPEPPQILHLVPCTWEHFLEVDPPHTGNYDYVDGLIVWCPMADLEHQRLSNYFQNLLCYADNTIDAWPTPGVQLLADDKGNTEWTVAEGSEDPPIQPSAPSSSAQPQFSLRHPDLALSKSTGTGSSSSQASTDPGSKIEFPYPLSPRLLLVVEITSTSTRDVDLYTKWNTYARSKVPMYVILDRGTKANNAAKDKRVIVGSLKPFSDAVQSPHGDPHQPPGKARKNAAARAAIAAGSSSSGQMYYRKVYKHNDFVDCDYFSSLNLQVTDILDRSAMKSHFRHERDKRDQAAHRAEQAERSLEEEKKMRGDAAQRAEQAEQRLEEEKEKFEQRLEEEKKKFEQRLEEEKNKLREEAEQRAKEVEQRAEREPERANRENKRANPEHKEEDQEPETVERNGERADGGSTKRPRKE